MSAIAIHLGYMREWEAADLVANTPDAHLSILYGWLTGRKFANNGQLPRCDETMLRLLDAQIARRRAQQPSEAMTG